VSLLQAQRDAERAAVLVAKELIAPQTAEHARLKAEVEEQGVQEAEEALVRSQKQAALARVGLQQIETLRAERDALARQRGRRRRSSASSEATSPTSRCGARSTAGC
jgi:hypothetical protein